MSSRARMQVRLPTLVQTPTRVRMSGQSRLWAGMPTVQMAPPSPRAAATPLPPCSPSPSTTMRTTAPRRPPRSPLFAFRRCPSRSTGRRGTSPCTRTPRSPSTASPARSSRKSPTSTSTRTAGPLRSAPPPREPSSSSSPQLGRARTDPLTEWCARRSCAAGLRRRTTWLSPTRSPQMTCLRPPLALPSRMEPPAQLARPMQSMSPQPPKSPETPRTSAAPGALTKSKPLSRPTRPPRATPPEYTRTGRATRSHCPRPHRRQVSHGMSD